MALRYFRRTTFAVRSSVDAGQAAWRVLYSWKVPNFEIGIADIPLLDAQRSQLRLRHLNEVLERKTGALLAIAVLTIGLADMVRTWNRDLEHMGMLLVWAIAAGLAGRIIGRVWVRLRIVMELLRLRRKVGKRSAGQTASADSPVASRVSPPPAALAPGIVTPLLKGSCNCGTIAFTLSSPPSIMGTCHCAHCRKSGASIFVVVKRSAFKLTSGSEAVATYNSALSHARAGCFCSRCGTALGEITSSEATFRVAASCFDDPLVVRNGFHEFVSEKPGWYGICDEARQFATQPPG